MDSKAFIEQVQKLERLLYSIAWSMLFNNEDCADAVQETLMKAWKNRETLKNEKLFKTWLTRIMINTCKDMLRRRQKNQWVPIEEQNLSIPEPEVDDEEVGNALNDLSEEQRMVLILRYKEGYKIREIAEMLALPISTVTTRIQRSKLYLKRALAR